MSKRESQEIKGLRTKSNVSKRLLKEFEYNVSESEKQKSKIEKMTSEGKDEHDIKQQQEVLSECMMMIPDSRIRLKESIIELKSNIEEVKDMEGVKDSDVLKEAFNMVELGDGALLR